MSDQHFAQIQNCVATGSQDEAQTWAGRPVRPGPDAFLARFGGRHLLGAIRIKR